MAINVGGGGLTWYVLNLFFPFFPISRVKQNFEIQSTVLGSAENKAEMNA
jgi:hypothetical protein